MARYRTGLNYAYLSEDAKRVVRRALLKAVAIPGFQVPFSGREMPMPYGWGTGGVQVTASLIGPGDVLKVIDQGADDTTNAVSIRDFLAKTAFCRVTEETGEATIIQTRHRIPETPLKEGQIMVYQVPIPDPLRFLEPKLEENRALHALREYGILYVKLYEDVTRHGEIAQSYDYPAMVNRRYAMSPSPIPRFDNPKLRLSPALHLFGAGREKRVYAVPPHCEVESLAFSDYPFRAGESGHRCELCGDGESFLDEMVVDDAGGRVFVCSDSAHCRRRRESLQGAELPRAEKEEK
ncbi:MAG: alpha-D-ribose 1-methylphosphonate 5-phosphate C-P-lyase PhnJ [Deltaproteobacteria bacterium]|jgi:alpha-D-ribose 1-methylphosphonate 5-phosphate C-P lyase|nr:alpha-D-ribose 1-methylphosphonate 5-phosphate C-P-lyase PhnJ [Deltaproteobacteria bacterium]